MRDGELLPLGDRICCCRPVVPLMQHEDGGSGVPGLCFPALSFACYTAKPEPFHIVPCLNKRGCLGGGGRFPSEAVFSFQLPNAIVRQITKTYFLYDAANALVALNCYNLVVSACTNVFYTLVILYQTVWSQISSNCGDNFHEGQLVMLFYCFCSLACTRLRRKHFMQL